MAEDAVEQKAIAALLDIAWRKATASGTGNCVEVARMSDSVLLRDSKKPEGAILAFSIGEWNAFIAGIRNGELDL